MPFTCGSIDIEEYKIFKKNEMRYYIKTIVDKDIKYAHEICEMLDIEWYKNFKKIQSNKSYDGKLVDFIMSYYEIVDLKQYV